MNDLVSVIIPVYNTGEKLERCIESVERSSYENIEILLIDDGSNKMTSDICDLYEKKYKNVIVFHNENRGVSYSRNFGIKKSNGSYIMFVDSDDILDKMAIEILYTLCVNNNADFSLGNYRECISYNFKKYSKYSNDNCEIVKNDEILKMFLCAKKIGWNIWAKLYKKELIENIEFPFNMQTGEDMYFLYQVCKKAKVLVITDIILYNYIIHKDSVMNSKKVEKYFDTFELISEVYKECPDNNIYRLFYYTKMIWLFKFICANCNKISEKEIYKYKNVFIDIIEKNEFKIKNIKSKFEFVLLSRFYNLFTIYSKIYFFIK